jgi:hypothetical protein
MIDHVNAVDQRLRQLSLRDIPMNQLKAEGSWLMFEEVKVQVDCADIVSVCELTVDQMASNESACAGDEDSHASFRFRAVTMTALFVRLGSRLSNRLIARATGKNSE